MNVRYDLDLVEGAVALCAAGHRKEIHALQIRRFQFEREAIYSVLDPDERNAAFSKLHLKWFRNWNLEQLIKQILNEFTNLSDTIQILAFRKARTKSEEAAELYVDPSGKRNGVVALRSERFKLDGHLNPFLRHELMHLSDMVRPEFGYARDPLARQQGSSQQHLARERYRLLWAVSIDGRLVRSDKETVATKEQRWLEFDRAYHFWPEGKRYEVFASLWADDSPKHMHLRDLAMDPREAQKHSEPFPGALCPLCSFPTFDWADAPRFTPQVTENIGKQFPNWELSTRACNRCVEIYEMSRMEYPATLCL
jgi:hypothetical protein